MKRKEFIKTVSAGSAALWVLPSLTSCASHKKKTAAVWETINNNGPAFAYVHPKKGVPNVLLYGDSISIGYTATVRDELEGKASVFRIFNNGMSSNQLIAKMERLEKTMFTPHLPGGWNFEWDVIHFNVGLHDLKHMKNGQLDLENGKIVSSIPKYKENLREICEYLQEKFPKTKLIFATTTPVPENAKGRKAGDAKLYNEAALEVLKDFPSIKINDLYAYTLPHHQEWMIKPGDVHYNERGKTEQGKRVAHQILEQLNQ